MALEARGITKVFPGTRALDHISLTLRRGEIHALCGGNGCGKSTLIKILSGVLQADSGTVLLNDVDIDVTQVKPAQVHELGLRVVHQDLAVFPDLSIAENMMLGSGYPVARGRIQWRETRRRAQAQIDRFEIPARPENLLRDLPVGTRAQVAIARALQDVSENRGIVILDEPTASLPSHEVELLLAAIRRLAAQGHAILFVSHRLDEVLALTDRVTVMRDGRVVARHETAKLNESELIESILGRRADEIGMRHSARPLGNPVLQTRGLTAGPVTDIGLEVRAGEVVGIAGLLGSGRTELLRSICGDLPKKSGTVVVNGKRAEFRRIDQAIGAGVVMIPEDRPRGAVFPDLPVNDNLDVGVLGRYWRWSGFRNAAMRRDDAELRTRFRVKSESGSVQMKSLSGGNQQKVIIARWLRRDPVLLLLDEPTQGVDVGARADIYTAVREVTENGGAAVVVASDLEELTLNVDRALVLRKGRIVAEVTGADLNVHRLTELIYADDAKSGDRDG
ncbi:sugar ABC transporter ATP-binding protein [Streptomyces carpinensis]|uniref:Sugar ABC transporter ATP-binding protein n=1 Tax=Streptomyces carpinensis TaxID=66369 RepID=A0ABV1VUR1_9ACTN|nr:sugar ABC transporter ATP-binding protein [Streptomyces carpinensis]